MKVKSIRKFSAYAGSALLAVTLLVLLFALKPDSTVDFRGIVKSVEYNSREKCTYFTAYMLYDENSSIIIKAKDGI